LQSWEKQSRIDTRHPGKMCSRKLLMISFSGRESLIGLNFVVRKRQ